METTYTHLPGQCVLRGAVHVVRLIIMAEGNAKPKSPLRDASGRGVVKLGRLLYCLSMVTFAITVVQVTLAGSRVALR